VGNLTCRDCGLTFIARWGSVSGADEYRCDNDHVVFVDPSTGALLGLPAGVGGGATLADVFGRCPMCHTDLGSGLLPSCPVCSGRDHEVVLGGVVG
jgi:hypothetical protein